MIEKYTLNTTRAEAFADFMVDTLNKSALSLMISIGHRARLFDTMHALNYATSEEIAEKAGLHERYVREWLGAVTTGGVVEYSPETKTFHLPPEHAAYLTREAGADNMAVFMQYIAVMGEVEDDILKCFKEGGGVPYARYHRFHDVMAEDSGQSVLSSLESHILPLVPGLTDKLKAGIQVLDVGCGSGRFINKLAELFPESHFTGLDLSAEAVGTARAEAASLSLQNVEFVEQDLSDFDQKAPQAKYDLITSLDAIHDQGKPFQVLKGIYKALKNDGVYLMQDISGTSHLEEDMKHPIGPFLYTISCMHCMTVSLAQNGEGLGAMWGEETTKEYLHRAGFSSVKTNKLAHDIQNNWYVVQK
ncbi:class I SAM-dependent methyltransferase [Pontibacter beigongshangensis]|uniref:class I SAM-dependent methyltransferase n=1 Tax=Pontibacter beigongshangensis TaxID=2574733 RepID=UPI00165056CB|nr:class I SAM-dependent methyltransferase [Pontibacter beigongshangensis]